MLQHAEPKEQTASRCRGLGHDQHPVARGNPFAYRLRADYFICSTNESPSIYSAARASHFRSEEGELQGLAIVTPMSIESVIQELI